MILSAYSIYKYSAKVLIERRASIAVLVNTFEKRDFTYHYKEVGTNNIHPRLRAQSKIDYNGVYMERD